MFPRVDRIECLSGGSHEFGLQGGDIAGYGEGCG